MSSAAVPLRSDPKSHRSSEAPGASGAAHALARVQAFVKDHRMAWKERPGGFGEFERELHARVMAFERELVAEGMACADVDAEAVEIDGVVYRKVLRAEEEYLTAAGPVRAAEPDQHDVPISVPAAHRAPLDERGQVQRREGDGAARLRLSHPA